MKNPSLRALIVVTLSLLCGSGAGAAPTASVQGTLFDPWHHRLLAGAIVDVAAGGMVMRTESDARGHFGFVGLPAGEVTVQVTADHYSRLGLKTCALPSETRTLPLDLLWQFSVVSDAMVFERLVNEVNAQNDNAISAPHFDVPRAEYDVGFCAG